MPLTDQAARRREYVLLVLGIAIIAIAILFVFNGKPSNFMWEYPACVAWREVGCPHIQGAVHCNHSVAECIQTQMRLFPWLYTWLVESAIVTGLALAAVYRTLKRK
jgi:hypothetical protein